MPTTLFTAGKIILPDRILDPGQVLITNGTITTVMEGSSIFDAEEVVDLQGNYLAPGYIDLHVHGGNNADFMDGTSEAFETVCRAHARHGTTSLLPTTTVASHRQIIKALELVEHYRCHSTGGSQVLGAHFYGPYFGAEAVGCHPAGELRPPKPQEYREYLRFKDSITTATVAPELPGAEGFVRDCRANGIRCNVGHSHATFEQMERALGWGVSHVDHLFCAMSDRARLRQEQTYPMRGGVLEATLYFDELTTEVIADGKHLQRELLLLAYKIKGPDRLALATDCNRALDMPDGEYLFGPLEEGEPIIRRNGVGIMPNGKSLASSVVGMDHCVKTFRQLTDVPLVEVIRMASLTPARIAGWEEKTGSIEVGKQADLLILNPQLEVEKVYLNGTPLI